MFKKENWPPERIQAVLWLFVTITYTLSCINTFSFFHKKGSELVVTVILTLLCNVFLIFTLFVGLSTVVIVVIYGGAALYKCINLIFFYSSANKRIDKINKWLYHKTS